MSRMISEEAVVVGAVPIFEALKLNPARLLSNSLVDFLASVEDVKRVDRIDGEELKSPDDVGSVFDVAALLEALEGNGLRVVGAIETADNDESCICVALKFLKLANGIIDAEFGRVLAGGSDLEIVKADDRSFLFIEAKRFKASKQFINGFVLQFQNLQVGLRISNLVNDAIELGRPRAAPNICGGQSGLLIAEEKLTSDSF